MRQRGPRLSLLIGLLVFALAVPVPALAAVSVGGFVLGTFLWSDKINGSYCNPPTCAPARGGGAVTTPLDTDKDRDNPQFIATAKQSRIWARFTDEVAAIRLSGAIEGDFNTTEGNALTSNSSGLRLRLAYARADHPGGWFLLAGQYYTVSNNEDIGFLGKYAGNDVNGPTASRNGARQPQLRVGWKSALAKGRDLTFEAAIEKHSTANLGSASVDESQGEGQTVPLGSARVTYNSPNFRIQAGVAVAENTVILTGGNEESEGAWMLFGSAEVIFLPFTFFLNAHGQDGLGRLLGGAGDFPGVFLVNNQIESLQTQGLSTGIKFQLTPETALDLVYGWQKADEITAGNAFTGSSLEKVQSLEVNIAHRFWKSWRAVLALMRFDVEAFNGTEGDNNLLALFLTYFF